MLFCTAKKKIVRNSHKFEALERSEGKNIIHKKHEMDRKSQGKIVSTLKIYEAVKSIRYDIGHHVRRLLTRNADVGSMRMK